MIVALRTDSPTAEFYLFDAKGKEVDKEVWEAGKQLSVQILSRLKELLERNQVSFNNLTGLVVFKGPGSFTGLRISIMVANTIAYSQKVPVVGGAGINWLKEGVKELATVKLGIYVMPEYGAEPHITSPK